ncbi:MAG: Uma2 family endonuclease [Bacteroidota bacterium]
MGIAIDLKGKYSYADYLTWPDEERWELIEGYPYDMSPAPNRKHQGILGELFRKFADHFDDKPCRVYVAPFDVRLAEDYTDDHLIENVVQPDISVFCKKDRLDTKGAVGAPDLVVEILSPSTTTKDIKTKLLLYQKYKVNEYWIVDPVKESVEILVLDEEEKYNPGTLFEKDQVVHSTFFETLVIDLPKLFQAVND